MSVMLHIRLNSAHVLHIKLTEGHRNESDLQVPGYAHMSLGWINQ